MTDAQPLDPATGLDRGPAGLVIEQRGAVIDVTIDRPPGNLFTTEMCRELAALLEEPPGNVHLLRIVGAGGVFCLGRERPGSSVEDLRPEVEALVRLNDALSATRLVTVAEVTGDAAGFGVGIAALSDVAVSSHDARYWFPEVTIGLAPSLVLAWLARLVGRRTAFWLTATGEKISAEQAVAIGLVNECVRSDELAGRVAEVLEALGSRAPRVHAQIKDMLALFDGLGGAATNAVATDRLILGSLARLRP